MAVASTRERTDTNANERPRRRRGGLRYYGLRLTEDMLDQLHVLKEKEIVRLGVPVHVSALCRKFILDGMDRLAKEHRTTKP